MASKTEGFSFEVDAEQAEMAADWREKHVPVCRIKSDGAIGGRYTWSFTATTVGDVVIVTCACGAKVDISFYKTPRLAKLYARVRTKGAAKK